MILLNLSDGSSIFVKIDEIKILKSHGNKTLIFVNYNEPPFCSQTTIKEIQKIIQERLEKGK